MQEAHKIIKSKQEWGCSEFPIGAMLETPRACIHAYELTQQGALFFSFGTNDLTQFTWGLSRDDADKMILPSYRENGYINSNPFEILDKTVTTG